MGKTGKEEGRGRSGNDRKKRGREKGNGKGNVKRESKNRRRRKNEIKRDGRREGKGQEGRWIVPELISKSRRLRL